MSRVYTNIEAKIETIESELEDLHVDRLALEMRLELLGETEEMTEDERQEFNQLEAKVDSIDDQIYELEADLCGLVEQLQNHERRMQERYDRY